MSDNPGSNVGGPTPDWNKILPVGGGGTAAVPPKCQRCDEWRRKAESAESRLADLTGGVTLRESIIRERDTLAVQVGEMRRALIRAHACATLQEDGSCRGCFVSWTLALTHTRSEAISEARKKVCEAADTLAAMLGTVDHPADAWYADALESLDLALAALDAAEGGGE